MLKQKIAWTAMQFPVALILSVTFLTGCLEDPVMSDVNNVTNQNPGQTDTSNGNGGGADTTNNSGTPDTTVVDGTDYVGGYWGASSAITSESRASTTSPAIKSQNITVTDSGIVFLSWVSTYMENSVAKEKLTTMRYTPDATTGVLWSDPNNNLFQPAGFTADAASVQFTANPVKGDGYALWESGNSLKTSEFMSSMSHFMGTATVAMGHVPQILVDSTGAAFMVTQTHMDGGFGISVHARTSYQSWADAVQLHRMDMTNAIDMPNHFLHSFVDGQDNILSVWLEQQGGLVSLKSARFDVANNLWGATETILDSNNTYGVDLLSLQSMAAVGESASSNMHLVLSQDTGTEKSLFTIDYHSVNGGWQMPMRRDNQMMSSLMSSASKNGHLLVAWQSSNNNMYSVNALHYSPGTGWTAASEVAMAQAGVVISDLTTAVNSSGHALTSWIETEGTEKRLLTSLQMPGQAWAQKELASTLSTSMAMSKPLVAMREDGTPWIVLTTQQNNNGNINFNFDLVKRLTTIHNATSVDTTTGDGHTDHTHNDGTGDTTTGSSGNTTDTGTGDSTSGSGTGTTTGDTTTGTGTGTTTGDGHTDHTHDAGTGTADNTTGTSTNTGTTTDPATGMVSGAWGEITNVSMISKPLADHAMFGDVEIQTANNGDVFAYWLTMSHANNTHDITIMHGDVDTAGNLSWTAADSAMMKPFSYDINAMRPQFFVNPYSGDGIASWNLNSTTYTSELMANMGTIAHFMNNTTLTDGGKPQVHFDQSNTYLVMQTAMTGGFGLSVFKRDGADSWSTSPAMLHRMDGTNAYSIYNNLLFTAMDGLQNIRAIWIEEQAGVLSLQTATYFSSTGSWGVVSEIHAHDIMLDKILSAALITVTGNSNLQLVIHEQNGASNKIYSVAYDSTGWQMPVRLDSTDAGIAVVSAPVIAKNMNGDTVVVWVETNSAMTAANSTGLMQMVMAKTFMPGMGWGATQHVANAQDVLLVQDLAATVTSAGDTSIAWTEGDTSGVRIYATHLVAPNNAWSQKELIGSVSSTDGTIQSFTIGMDSMDMPIVMWGTTMADTVNTMLSMWRSTRLTAISDAQVAVDNGSDTHDHGTGADSGTGTGTDAGTGTDTTTDTGSTNGTDSGSTNGTGNNTSTNTDVTTGLWNQSESISATQFPVASMGMLTNIDLQVTDAGRVFSSWVINSDMDMNTMSYAKQDIGVIRGTPDAVNSYIWSDPQSAMYDPVGYTGDASGSQFVSFPSADDDNGVAIWKQGTNVFVSEFMGSMGHFMGNPSVLPDGFKPQIHTTSTGQVYLLIETPMMGGFGLSVYKRTGFNQWSATPVQLHRMNMDNPLSIPGHLRISTVDGEDNLRVIWVESTSGIMVLRSATYFTATDSWSGLSDLQLNASMQLDKLVSGIAVGSHGTNELQLVLHQQADNSHAIFTATSDMNGVWSLPVQLDEQSATAATSSVPAFAKNHHGDILVAWMETDTSMTATNTSGLMNMLVSRSFMPGMGWSDKQTVAHASMVADVSHLDVAINHEGKATAVWLESSASDKQILSSHWLMSNSAWSQKESLATLATGEMLQAITVKIDSMNMPIVFWGTRMTDGVNDTFQIWRDSRSTAMDDATVATSSGSTNTDNSTDTTTDHNHTGTDTTTTDQAHTSMLWTAPELAMEIMHDSATSTQYIGPEIVRDDLGNNVVNLSLINTSVATGAVVTNIDNHMVRDDGVSNWQDILTNSGLLDDLSDNVMLESMRVVSATGNLFGLIRDGNTLYLARYLANAGWSKMEIPGVPANLSRQNLQLSTNESGMVTVTWHQPSSVCCTVDIHAKHFMLATGWQTTETISVPAQAVLTPHFVSDNGNVQAAWLEDNPDVTAGGFNIKLATYQPMTGWSTVIDGPTGVRNAMTKTVSDGEHQMVIVPNLTTNMIDVYIVGNDGNWSLHSNINHKMDADNVTLINPNDIQIVSSGAGQFMLAWREAYLNTDGFYEVRYMTATAHHMLDASTGMEMWHWMTPSHVGGDISGIESNISFAMDRLGNAYAVWNSVDLSGAKSHVYVNQAGEDGMWHMQPEVLAEYDVRAGNSASRPSIDVNVLNEVAISWDQHVISNTMTMHKVWVVENQ